MALRLVGETLDKSRSHYGAETGKLVQLMRGIYVDAEDDIDAAVLRHAVRIARYLHPQAYLSAASAALLGPTRDGRLFLSARRKQRTRIRGLEIIQNEAPEHPSVGSAVIDDGMGEFRINVSSIRQRFLEAFRLRSEHAASIDEDMREAIAARLIEEYGSPKGAADAVWALARENEWYREGELAERFFLHRPAIGPIKNQAALDLTVAWHGAPIGHLTHDGFEWRWTPLEGAGPPLVRQTTPGKLPPFIVSLLPEGWLETVLKDRDERAMLRSGKRYMSNITIVGAGERAGRVAVRCPADPSRRLYQGRRIHRPLCRAWPGRYRRKLRAQSGADLRARRNAAAFGCPDQGADVPRCRRHALAQHRQAVHAYPEAGRNRADTKRCRSSNGWLMALGRAAGFAVPATALAVMPDGMPPALIVERFDIRESLEDKRMLALEDLCSVLDLPTEAKYTGTMERVARAVRPLSTAPEEDLRIILKRALFAWLIADGDMHLKNMALLKIAEPGDKQFRSVRMAPLYDAVTTRVFPRLQKDRLALKSTARTTGCGGPTFGGSGARPD